MSEEYNSQNVATLKRVRPIREYELVDGEKTLLQIHNRVILKICAGETSNLPPLG
jgi:hypothetical protein